MFYDGATSIGNRTNSPYILHSPVLDHSEHLITARATDKFGLQATSQVMTASVRWPGLHELKINLAGTNCVVCMTAMTGSNYLIQTTTNLQSPIPWQPLITNLASGPVLKFTNQPTAPRLFYSAKLLP